MIFKFFGSHQAAKRDYVISIHIAYSVVYSLEKLRKISKNWEVLIRLNKNDFSQIGKFELSHQVIQSKYANFRPFGF